jgi:membrane-associated phospholipid phosphatase
MTAFLLLPVTLALTDAYLVSVNGTYPYVAGEDLLLMAQAAAFAVLTTQGVKFLTARERPFVHEMYPVEKPYTKDPLDNNLSFFSGHTAFVFALTVGAGTIAELRGYKQRWLVWALGLPVALLTPYLRIGADRHYLTDVATGALVGAAFGVGIPMLFHGRSGGLVDKRIGPDELSLVAGPGTVGVVGRF